MRVSNCGYDYRHEASYTAERPFGSIGHILMVVRSPARIRINNETHYTKGNCVVLYRKEPPQFFYAHNAKFVNDWVRFDLDASDFSFLERIGIQFDTIMEHQDVYALSRLIKLLYIEKQSNSPTSEESMTLILRLLFLKLSDYFSQKPMISSKLSEKLAILKNNIYSNPQNNWSIDGICQSMSISPSYLQHKYKQLFGVSVKSDITESRIQYSKWLLTNTTNTVVTISQMAGYANEVTFMYIFKKKTGLTPTQYRNSINQTL